MTMALFSWVMRRSRAVRSEGLIAHPVRVGVMEGIFPRYIPDVEFNENEIYVLGADMTVGRPQPVKGAVLKPAKVKRTGTFREGKEQRFAQMNPANTLVRSELNSSEEIKTRDGRAGRPHCGG